jgi:hypothetical protein
MRNSALFSTIRIENCFSFCCYTSPLWPPTNLSKEYWAEVDQYLTQWLQIKMKRWNVISKQQYLYDYAHLVIMWMYREQWHFHTGQGRQCMCKVNIEARLYVYNHFSSGKAISITYCQCVFFALGIQHVMHMCCIVICGQLGSTIFFLYYLINNRGFEKKIIDHKICVLISYITFIWNISYSKKQWAR